MTEPLNTEQTRRAIDHMHSLAHEDRSACAQGTELRAARRAPAHQHRLTPTP